MKIIELINQNSTPPYPNNNIPLDETRKFSSCFSVSNKLWHIEYVNEINEVISKT